MVKKDKQKEEISKTDWNDMENVAIKFHKMFKDSGKILEAVRAVKASEGSLIDLKNQEKIVVGNLSVLRQSGEQLTSENNGLVASIKENKKISINLKAKVNKLENKLASDCADKKAELDEGLKEYASTVKSEMTSLKKSHEDRIEEMDKELEAKQKLITSAENTLNKLKSKLA